MREWPTELQLAYNDIRSELQAAAKHRQQAREQEARQQREAAEKQATLRVDIDNAEAELRSLDNEAYEFAMGKLKNGEVLEKDKKAIQQALVKGDKDTVKKYFEQFRKEYHAVKAGINTGEKVREKGGPARLEGSGAGSSSERYLPPDYSELGKLQSFDDKLAWMRKHNIKP
jgi:regulator of protease activity HflC (stomatin/prohibitin superfamily)